MYISDGLANDIFGKAHKDKPQVYMWGWLGNAVEPKNIQTVPLKLKNIVIKTLKTISEPVDLTKGFHKCEICNNKDFNGSIKILYENILYVAPFGVEHYIEDHGYWPDDEVVSAIIDGDFCGEEDLYIDMKVPPIK